MMNNKYNNAAILLSFRTTAFQDAEGEALLEILPAHTLVECFVDFQDISKFKELEMRKQIIVGIKLVCFTLEKVEKLTKKIESIRLSRLSNTAVNKYFIFGEVVDIKNGEAIVNCGFYVLVEYDKNKNSLKIGDWVKAEGRLDAYLTKNNQDLE